MTIGIHCNPEFRPEFYACYFEGIARRTRLVSPWAGWVFLMTAGALPAAAVALPALSF